MTIEVHRTLGSPGLLESIYESALCHELILRVLRIQRQKPVQVMYKGIAIREPLFIDIVVEYKVLNSPYAAANFSRNFFNSSKAA